MIVEFGMIGVATIHTGSEGGHTDGGRNRTGWHEWEYDITTDQSVFDPNVKVLSYPVEVVDGDVTAHFS